MDKDEIQFRLDEAALLWDFIEEADAPIEEKSLALNIISQRELVLEQKLRHWILEHNA